MAALSRAQLSAVIVYAAVFALFLDLQSLSPLMAPYARSLGASVAMAGVIGGAYSAVNLLGNLGAGWWADRVGRRRPLILGLALLACALFLYPFVREPQALLAVRLVHGLSAAFAAPACLAYIGDRAAVGSRGRSMAYYGAMSGMAGLMGPPLAGALRDRAGYAAVFLVLAGLMLLLALAAASFVSESLTGARTRPSLAARRALANRRLLLAYTSAFCWMFALGTLLVFLPLFGQGWGFTSARIGLLFGSFALAAFVIQASPLGRVSDRWGRERTLAASFAIVALALVFLSVPSQWPLLMAGMFVVGIGFGFLFPAMSALIADETDPPTRGTASGIFTATYSLGAVAGMGAAGGLEWLRQAFHLHPFLFAALIVLLGMVWAAWEHVRRRRV